jgi:hypothetical protein
LLQQVNVTVLLLRFKDVVQVPAGATVCLLHFMEQRHKVGRLARSSASTLQLHFDMDPSARPDARPVEVGSGGWAAAGASVTPPPRLLPYAPEHVLPVRSVPGPWAARGRKTSKTLWWVLW